MIKKYKTKNKTKIKTTTNTLILKPRNLKLRKKN